MELEQLNFFIFDWAVSSCK